jgi:hypothetical protein
MNLMALSLPSSHPHGKRAKNFLSLYFCVQNLNISLRELITTESPENHREEMSHINALSEKIIGCAIEVQIMTYMRLSHMKLGLLLNFNEQRLVGGISRESLYYEQNSGNL